MNINFIIQPLIRHLAITSVLLPVLSITQPMAQATAYETQAATTSNTPSAASIVSPSEEVKQSLMTKLAKLAFFSADFSQEILNEQGELLQTGAGNFAISKPNLVNWQTTTPDETLIVSDGKTLWFYDPFIEQVSAFSLAKSIHNTPILLLTSDDPTLWQQYTVIEKLVVEQGHVEGKTEIGSIYVVIPKDESSQIKKLTLSFTKTSSDDANSGQLSEFSFQDATGQISQITLSHFNNKTKPAAELFTFTLPEGVRLEDKR
ncbi:MAG: outer membrane lipoprotein chaperone LolA [Colwellia sp.]